MGKRLSKITTRTGDKGTTGLADGSRVEKTHPRIVAIGEVDELNSAIGLLRATLSPNDELEGLLSEIQHDLFDLGGALSLPEKAGEIIGKEHVESLENALEKHNAGLPAMENFILPAGTPAVAACHFCRAVSRRAERNALALHAAEPLPLALRQYLNRLSDLLFVLARTIGARGGEKEVIWRQRRRQ